MSDTPGIDRDHLIAAIDAADGLTLTEDYSVYGYGGEVVDVTRLDSDAVADFFINYLKQHYYVIGEEP